MDDEDPYGRRKYYGYRASDETLICTITCTVPEQTLANFAAVWSQTRDLGPNAKYIVHDAIRDATGQLTQIIDGRGVETRHEYDSRGRETNKRTTTTMITMFSECTRSALRTDLWSRAVWVFLSKSPQPKQKEGPVRSTVQIQGGGNSLVQRTISGALALTLAISSFGCDSRRREVPGTPSGTLATFCSVEFCDQVTALEDELNQGNFGKGLESCTLVFGKIATMATTEAIGEELKREGFEGIDQEGVFRIFSQLRSNHLFEESIPVQRMGIYTLGYESVVNWKVFQRNDGPRESTTILMDELENRFLAVNVVGRFVVHLSETKVKLQD
jgi:YD repeat-containing protein